MLKNPFVQHKGTPFGFGFIPMLMQDAAEEQRRLLFGVMKIGETLQGAVDGIGVERRQDAVSRQRGINDEFQLFRGTHFAEPDDIEALL